jgi:hypothetical protein
LAEDGGFLARWSRLKRAERERLARPADPAPPTAAAPGVVAEEDPLKDLPPLDSLTGESDFRPFMREGVPEKLRNQALRKLWSSDSVYANLDGLVEYGEDFGEPFRVAGVVATVYRVLEGMPDPATPSDEPTHAEEPAAEPNAGEAETTSNSEGSAAASPIEAAEADGIE